MKFVTVNEIRNLYPDKEIILLSDEDYKRGEEEKDLYSFKILPMNLPLIQLQLGGIYKAIWWLRARKNTKNENKLIAPRFAEIFKNTDAIIDISGYALSSQWGWFPSVNYLLNIIVAKKYSIPYYIFPQSIGPFNYSLKYKVFLYPLMKLYLKYPKKIFIREKDGIKWIYKFTRKNVEKKYDIVLQNQGYNLTNIFKKKVNLKNIEIENNSVGIIPNLRVIEHANSDEIYSIYNSLINRLIDAKKTVYILRHSHEDLEVCEKIYNFSSKAKSIRLIPDDLSAIELENITKQFDFVIASRYHSIIHSYKNGILVLVIGWATKYFELLENFDQIDYFFDGRDRIDIDEINNKIDKLIGNYKYESEKIIDKMNAVSKENIFDIFA